MELYRKNAFVPSSLSFFYSVAGLSCHDTDLQTAVQSMSQVVPTLFSQAQMDLGHTGCFQSFCLIKNATVNITCIIRVTFRSGATGMQAKSPCSTGFD